MDITVFDVENAFNRFLRIKVSKIASFDDSIVVIVKVNALISTRGFGSKGVILVMDRDKVVNFLVFTMGAQTILLIVVGKSSKVPLRLILLLFLL